jgi:hypothetical protein
VYVPEMETGKPSENAHFFLISNCTTAADLVNQIKELVRRRKSLVKRRHDELVAKDKEQVEMVAQARDQDLKVPFE